MSIDALSVKEEERAETTPKSGKKRALLALAGAQVIDNGEGQILNSLFVNIRDALGLNIADLGIISASKRIGGLLFSPVWGILSDRYGRKNVLVWGTGIWGLWTLLIGFSQSYAQLFILSLISSIGLAAINAPLAALVSDMYPIEQRGRAFGVINSLSVVGTILILIFFTGLSQDPESGWRIGYYFLGCASVVSGFLIWWLVEEPVRGQTEAAMANVSEDVKLKAEKENDFDLADVPALFKIPTIQILLVQTLVSMFPFIALISYGTVWLVDARDFRLDLAILLGIFSLLGQVVGSIFGGLLGDWMEKRSPSHGRVLLGQVSVFLNAMALYLLTAIVWDGATMIGVLFFCTGLLMMVTTTGCLLPLQSAVLLPELRSTGYSLTGAFTGLGRAIAGLVIGFMVLNYGFDVTFFWTVTIPTIIFALLFFFHYPTYSQVAQQVQNTLAQRREAALN